MEFNYHHLRYFQAVAEEGNLTRAAALLNVSQSAVSMQIRQLEERLGQALFERRGRALLLTEAGRIALDHANTIFATGREMVATLQQTGASRQVLRVGAISTLSRNFQLAFLKPVLGRPDVEIVLRSGSMAELGTALAALHLDLVLTNQAPPTDALTPFNVQQLDTQNISLVGPPDRTLAQVPLAEILIRRPLILPTRASGVRAGFDALTERLGLRPQIAAEVDDMAMMRLLVRDGAGLAVLPPIVVRDEIAAGTLTELAVLSELTETFYGVTVGRRFPNPLLVELLQVR